MLKIVIFSSLYNKNPKIEYLKKSKYNTFSSLVKMPVHESVYRLIEIFLSTDDDVTENCDLKKAWKMVVDHFGDTDRAAEEVTRAYKTSLAKGFLVQEGIDIKDTDQAYQDNPGLKKKESKYVKRGWREVGATWWDLFRLTNL